MQFGTHRYRSSCVRLGKNIQLCFVFKIKKTYKHRTSESGETRFCSARIWNSGLMSSAAFAAAVDFALRRTDRAAITVARAAGNAGR